MATNGELGWTDAIEKDDEFIVLPEGDYEFQVTNFERGRFQGSEKMGPCAMAALTLSVDTPKGTANAKTRLYLHTKAEWKLSEFFRCIGLKKHGEKLIMDWNKVPGARGRAHFAPRTYNGSEYNDVKKFLDYAPEKMGGATGNEDFMRIPKDADEEIPFD